MVVVGGESVTIPTARLVCGEVWGGFPARSGEVSARSRSMSTSPSSSVSVSGRELSVEVDPEASALRVGGARVESQRGRAIIVPLRSRAETVTVPTGVIERTGVLPKEVSGEVVESTEAADEGGSWVASAMGSSLVSGVMSNHLLGNCAERGLT